MAQQNINDILVVIFPSRKILVRALEHLNTVDEIDIRRAAIVAKAADGETIILDDDLSADEGGIAGGTLGAGMAAFGMSDRSLLNSGSPPADPMSPNRARLDVRRYRGNMCHSTIRHHDLRSI